MNIKNIIKNIYYKYKNRNKNIKIDITAILAFRDVSFEGMNVIHKNVIFRGKLGYGSYIGDNCNINAVVGRYCSIASNVKTISGVHPTSTFVSTHPCFFSIKKQAGFTYVQKNKFSEDRFVDKYKHLAKIGNDVWIGSNVTILPGIEIGDGAIVAAGSVVSKNIPPYSIVGGVPCRLIKKRFSDKQIDVLERFQWWDKDIKWIEQNADKFSDIEVFCDLISL